MAPRAIPKPTRGRATLNDQGKWIAYNKITDPSGSPTQILGNLEAPAPTFTPPAALTPSGQPGDVVVQKGAQLRSPTTPEKVGGRIILAGPNVRNEGTIATPDGQTIIGAGLQVGFTAHASSDRVCAGWMSLSAQSATPRARRRTAGSSKPRAPASSSPAKPCSNWARSTAPLRPR